jgi:hypothetical protein
LLGLRLIPACRLALRDAQPVGRWLAAWRGGCAMGKKATQRRVLGKPESYPIPDRLAGVSANLISVIRQLRGTVDFLPGGECGESREHLYRQVVKPYSWQPGPILGYLEKEILELSDFYAAGYLELCKAAQLIQPPRFWGWREDQLKAPSHHAAAYQWARDRHRGLRYILSEEGRPNIDYWEEDEFNARVDLCQQDLKIWAEGVSNLPSDAMPIIAMERIQSLLLWEQVEPWAKHQQPEDDEDDIWQRYKPPACDKCNGRTRVEWCKYENGKRTRKIVCRDPACNHSKKLRDKSRS